MTSSEYIEVPLYEIAHGRTGDKGDRLNVSIIPYDDSGYTVIADQATEERMLSMFRHRGATEARRYGSPKLKALTSSSRMSCKVASTTASTSMGTVRRCRFML